MGNGPRPAIYAMFVNQTGEKWWTGPMADAEQVGGRGCGADPGLGVTDAVSRPSPFARPAAFAASGYMVASSRRLPTFARRIAASFPTAIIQSKFSGQTAPRS